MLIGDSELELSSFEVEGGIVAGVVEASRATCVQLKHEAEVLSVMETAVASKRMSKIEAALSMAAEAVRTRFDDVSMKPPEISKNTMMPMPRSKISRTTL